MSITPKNQSAAVPIYVTKQPEKCMLMLFTLKCVLSARMCQLMFSQFKVSEV